MKPHGVAATKGHLASNGGLRGHSVDELYPLSVIAKVKDGFTLWQVMHLGTGKTDVRYYSSAARAHRRAAKLKQEGWK